MTNKIGLLVMHGIGSQKAGSVGKPLADSIAGSEVVEQPSHSWSTTVNGRPVMVAEANWSHTSSPDNPPVVRLDFKFLSDMIKSVTSGYQTFFGFGHFLSKQAAIFAVIFAHILLAAWALVSGISEEITEFKSLHYVIMALGLALCFAVLLHHLQHHESSERRGLPVNIVLAMVLSWFFMVFIASVMIYQFVWIILSSLAFLPLLVVWPITWLVRTASSAGVFGKAKIWVHRLSWLIFVAPVQTFCQFIKGIGNMFSVAFVGPGTLLSRIGTYSVATVMIVLLAFVIVIWPIIILLPLGGAAWLIEGVDGITSVVLLIVYIPILYMILKHTQTLLDLSLDVSGYHLAPKVERRGYAKFAQQGIEMLRDNGCSEIHVLAHSLGTVIIYDWLRAANQDEISDIVSLTTLGSPLYKFWYIDHNLEERTIDTQGFDASKLDWHNFYAWSDPVSNRLQKFGVHVAETRLRWLGLWGVAHVKYWDNQKVIDYVKTKLGNSHNS